MATATIENNAEKIYSPSGSTREEVLASIESWIPQSQGFRIGYIATAQASLIGLGSGYYVILFRNYSYWLLIGFNLAGSVIRMLTKTSSGWASSWKDVDLT